MPHSVGTGRAISLAIGQPSRVWTRPPPLVDPALHKFAGYVSVGYLLSKHQSACEISHESVLPFIIQGSSSHRDRFRVCLQRN